ncbi:hypothetical protein HJD18_16780 [Thermoleophilia bacterium SCSIO 60948]|nr:hypothetical protein HJD18_16780 [Thermoleophilia bacterium SCSIO 60948]
MRRLASICTLVTAVLCASAPAIAADRDRGRDPDSPPKLLAQVGETVQRTGLHTSTWSSSAGRGFCVTANSDGIPGDRAKAVAPGRRHVRLSFFRALRPAKVRLATYSRKTGPGEYAGRAQPNFDLRRFRDRRDRPAWRIVFSQRLKPGDLLRGEFYVRYPDTDGCGPDSGYGAFTFRAARPRD